MTDSANSERERLIKALRGKYKWKLPTVDEFLLQKHADAAELTALRSSLSRKDEEIEGLRADAARYRWLRECSGCDIHIEQPDDDGDMVFVGGYELTDLDQAVDSAIAAQAEGRQEGK